MKKWAAIFIISLFALSAFIAALPSGAHATAIESGAIVEYKLYNTTSSISGTTVIDTSGNGQNATLTGTYTVNSDSVTFSGTGQIALDTISLQSTYDIVIYIRIDKLASTMGQANTILGTGGYAFSTQASNDALVINNAGNITATTYTPQVSQYFLLEFYVTNDSGEIIINGNNNTAVSGVGTVSKLLIGKTGGTTDESYTTIEYFAIYDHLLSDAERNDILSTIGATENTSSARLTMTNATLPFTITQYHTIYNISIEGTNQMVHPSILYLPDSTGYKYMMAITPYPNENARYENPSVVFSNDLNTWTSDGINNPVNPAPSDTSAFNCDPDILYVNGTFYLYSNDGDYHATGVQTSTDGHNWSAWKEVLQVGGYGLGSPGVIYENGTFKMWGVHVLSDGSSHLYYYTSHDGYNFTLQYNITVAPITIDGNSVVLWHLDVQKLGNTYIMLGLWTSTGTSGSAPRYLLWATSPDGYNWTVNTNPVIGNIDNANLWVYRSSFFINNGKITIVYSYKNKNNGTWWAGWTTADISLQGETDNVIHNVTVGSSASSGDDNGTSGNDNGTGNSTGSTGGGGLFNNATGGATSWLFKTVQIGSWKVAIWEILVAAVVVLLIFGRR